MSTARLACAAAGSQRADPPALEQAELSTRERALDLALRQRYDSAALWRTISAAAR